MQRPHPAQRSCPQRMDFGHGKLVDHGGDHISDNITRRAPSMGDPRHINSPFCSSASPTDRDTPAPRKKPSMAASGASTRGPCAPQLWSGNWRSDHPPPDTGGGGRETGRRGIRVSPASTRPSATSFFRSSAALPRIRAGISLGEEFEQKIGHCEKS